MNAEVGVRALVIVLFIPALGAVVAYSSGGPSMGGPGFSFYRLTFDF